MISLVLSFLVTTTAGLLGLFLLSLASGVKISGLADSLSGLIKA